MSDLECLGLQNWAKIQKHIAYKNALQKLSKRLEQSTYSTQRADLHIQERTWLITWQKKYETYTYETHQTCARLKPKLVLGLNLNLYLDLT